MTITVPTHGQSNWDIPLNTALNDLQAQILINPASDAVWQPADQGYVTWTMDPAFASNATVLTSGVMALARVAVRAQGVSTVTVTRLEIGVNVAGITLTAGQNLAALYDSTGARLAITADQSATWNSIGHKSMNLTAPVNVAAGYYWIGLVSVGATPPQILRATTAAAGSLNSRTTAATTRFGTFGAALTSPPTSFAPGSIATSLNGWFMGAS
jgi:hypothetical protein